MARLLPALLRAGGFLVSTVQIVGEHLPEMTAGRVFLGDARVGRPHEHAHRRLESLSSRLREHRSDILSIAQESEVPDLPTIRPPFTCARATSPAPDGTRAMVGMSGAARPRASSFAVFSSDARRWVFFFPRTRRPRFFVRTQVRTSVRAVRSRKFLTLSVGCSECRRRIFQSRLLPFHLCLGGLLWV